MSEVKVGDRLWFVWSERRSGDPRWVVVTKIGRKWISTDYGYRFDRETLAADGSPYSSPGRAYRTREEWEIETANERSWDALRCSVYSAYRPPKGVSAETIEKAAALLGLQLEGKL